MYQTGKDDWRQQCGEKLTERELRLAKPKEGPEEGGNALKLMPALPESIFDILYLSFAIISGCQILKAANGRKGIRLMGAATLVLGCGDAFHLVPRVLNYWTEGDYTAALGIGKLVTSVTMTVFYLILEYVRMDRYKSEKGTIFTKIIWVLAALRIALCALPQNAWTSTNAPTNWGIYRNIPFLAIGVMTCVLWYRDAKEDSVFRFLYLAVLFSYAFYLPVVLLADKIPIVGMLMLPKTVMYIWMICMFRRAV